MFLRVHLISCLCLLSAACGFGATHILTVNTNGNGGVSLNPTGNIYPNGSVVTLTAVAAAGWTFDGWSGSIAGATNPTNVLMDSDKVITGNFSQLQVYLLTVQLSGEGTVSPSGGSFSRDTELLLTATPAPGWIFDHWEGSAQGSSNPLSLIMSADRTVRAIFARPPAITSEPTGGSVELGGTFSFSANAIGTAPLAYQWYANGAALPYGIAATFAVTNAGPQNGGSYTLVVSNPYGSVTSAVAVLRVSCPGTNVVSVATDAALRAAVSLGGDVRLCFDGTVTLTKTIEVDKHVTLDASGTSVLISGGNAVRLFQVNTGVVFQATNVVFANGRHVIDGASAPAEGAAIMNHGGTVRLTSCTLSNNYVVAGSDAFTFGEGHGGAICNAGGTVVLQNTALTDNRAESGGTWSIGRAYSGPALGGAVFSDGGSLSMRNCALEGNVAFSGVAWPPAEAAGGAVYLHGTSATIAATRFSSNKVTTISYTVDGHVASLAGGALYVRSGRVHLNRVAFLTNSAIGGFSRTASGSKAQGAALWNAGDMSVEASTIDGNIAAGGGGTTAGAAQGGGIFTVNSLAITASTISRNRAVGGFGRDAPPSGFPGADGLGGGVFSVGTLQATNCTIAGNAAEGGPSGYYTVPSGNACGGGIFGSTGAVTLVNVTVATNWTIPAVYRGTSFTVGANVATTNCAFALRNSLVAYGSTNENVWGTVLDGGHNMCSDGSANFNSGTSFNFTDPLLLPLENYGGPTLTMALAPVSPAIDWAPATGAPATDQRGLHRPVGIGVDLGAYEAGTFVPPLFAERIGNTLNLWFDGQPGVSYRLEYTTNLMNWGLQESIDNLTTNGVVQRTVPMNEPAKLFRLGTN